VTIKKLEPDEAEMMQKIHVIR